MKSKEEVIKDIAIILSVLPETGRKSNDRLRRLSAIEGMLIVLGELPMHQKLDYSENEGYENFILRHARICLQNQF